MANYPATVSAVDKQLVASTVDTVTFAEGHNGVEIVTDGTAKVYVTVDGSTPAVGADGTYMLPSGVVAIREIRSRQPFGISTVKLVSTGTPVYSVTEAG
jgi:hypothetical protein